MLIIGNQLKAARALAGVDQQTLADVAGVHVNTIRKMESKGIAEITSAADLVRRVQRAMEQLGVVSRTWWKFPAQPPGRVKLSDQAARSTS
jgi:transcriptional regulator with XRE-family HTH domain